MIVGEMDNVRSEENDANFGIVGWLPSDIDHVAVFMQAIGGKNWDAKTGIFSLYYESDNN